jgi:molybdopterin-guanine dinucleotide biosynthesis protein A
MLGIVLCGGQSSRMGSDKGLLQHEGKTWVQTTFEKLSEAGFPVKISVNEAQFVSYQNAIDAELLIPDTTDLDVHGPLHGVLSAHLHSPEQDLFVLACDVARMDSELIVKLHELYLQHLNYDAFVYTNDGEPEPLCAIYKAKALDEVMRLYRNNQLVRHSMKFVLSQFKLWEQPLLDGEKGHFLNFNTPDSLTDL